ncbi:uncharacterized protein RCC_02115 [Ramularia collo-cygni]|uniref:Uncharacterized protein n=1 Tax=Ramularia collo-cygni TaxID=112498 RepID=A0A2D3V7E2_9PEZI|nr:uncharacterized protein RCC_02115 [Ramularia collo-cygni]CZT16273.1 uncharacterized protein RCC_02115 [Ramularia collo-cygni]
MRCDDLRSRLENLPQELYDEIRALTFAFDFTSEARCIDQHGYKPPMQLQINQNLRAQFLPRYYGSEEDWVFVSRSRFDNHFKDVEMWLNSLSPEALFAVHNRKRRALPGRCDAEGHYSIVAAGPGAPESVNTGVE